jgi:signal transduction histidine kinase
MRYYAHQITCAQEAERARIARELHDDTIQSLIVLSRQLEALDRADAVTAPTQPRRLKELQQTADDIIQGVRRFSRDLRPSTLDDLGLLPTLEGLAASTTEKDGILTRFWVTGEKRRLSQQVELALFRIAQEALTNVKKHAAATQAVITVEFTGDAVRVTVRDNGKGFGRTTPTDELAASGHLGLIGMHERARLLGGTLLMQSQLELGTKVVVTVPTAAPPKSSDRRKDGQPRGEPLGL